MRRVSRGWVLLLVAAVGAFAVGTGLSVLLTNSDAPSKRRVVPAAPKAAPVAPAARTDTPAAIAARLPGPQLVGQLFAVGVRGTTASRGTLRSVRRHGWGGVVLTPDNWSGARGTHRMTARLAAAARAAHRPPLLVGADGVPGTVLAHGARATSARKRAAAAGRALRAAGVNLAIGPSADVGAAGGPLEQDSVSNDPKAVTRTLTAALSGFKRSKTIAAVGHFPGQGAAAGNPDTEPAPVGMSLDQLRSRDLRPFAAVVRSAPVVVASNAIYAAFDGATPAVLLPDAVNGLLRKRMGFRGVVMSDDLLAASATNQTDIGRTAVDAVRAGADLLYVPGSPQTQEQAYAAVLSAWQHGQLSTALLRQSVERVIALKQQYGLIH
jgi:beta-N-acetylhexosaminidase